MIVGSLLQVQVRSHSGLTSPLLAVEPGSKSRAEEEVEAQPARALSLAFPATVLAIGLPQSAPEEFRLSVHSECVRVSGFPNTHKKELHHMSFADLGVSRPLVDALKRRGITRPFPHPRACHRRRSRRKRRSGVQSPTGSVKTLAFGVPITRRRLAESDRAPAALVLVPTRELAAQIVEELEGAMQSRNLRIAAVYGGVGIQKQAKSAARAHVIVATPGRLEDLPLAVGP